VYGVVFVVVLVYVAIIAAKLVRLERQTAELLELVERRQIERTEAAAGEPAQTTSPAGSRSMLPP
jgi:hypothetical protein